MKLASLLDDGTPGYLWSYLQDFSHYEALTAKDTLDQGSPVKDEQRQDCKSVKEVRRYKYYKHIQNHLEKDPTGKLRDAPTKARRLRLAAIVRDDKK